MLGFFEYLFVAAIIAAIAVSSFWGFARLFNPWWPISKQDAVERAAMRIYALDPVEGWTWLACSELAQSGNPTAEYFHGRCIEKAKAALEVII